MDKLTPSTVANTKAAEKSYKLADGGGMFLLVQPNGSKWWRLKYRRPGTGKENLLSLGTFPEVSLKRARERRTEARRLLAEGIDPADRRQAEAVAAADTFEAVAREWHARQLPGWVASHASKVLGRLERDVFPWIGSKPIARLTAPEVLAVLRRIEGRGAMETAHRTLQHCSEVLRYAVSTSRAGSDVTRDLRGALGARIPRHFASITDPAKVGELLRAIHGFTGTYPVACALKLSPLVFTRPSELRMAEWAEFDLDAAEWNIPASRRKLKKAQKDDPATPPHLVPLSTQAVAILRDLQPQTGAGRYVFPGARDRKKALSDMALNAAFKRLGYDGQTFTAHGFRAMARTILEEKLGFRAEYIERQLDHAVKDANGRAYNRTSFLPERRRMMQHWAEYLDGLRENTGKVVAIGRKTSTA